MHSALSPALTSLARSMREHLEIKDRTYRFRRYEQCFVGSEAFEWMLEQGHASSEEEAAQLGNQLLNAGVFHHVLKDHAFKNEHLFYRFQQDETHGQSAKNIHGEDLSWADVMGTGWERHDASMRSWQSNLPEVDRQTAKAVYLKGGGPPLDRHNTQLLDCVHPPHWENPTAEGVYNMVVIGGGTAGLVTAAVSAGLGAKVAMIEANMLGGDCLNTGCVPSKALLASAKVAHQVRNAAQWGVHAQDVTVDFGQVMERVRRLRAAIAHHDSAARFSQELGVDVFIGRAEFAGPHSVKVDGQTLTFDKACVATGCSPSAPPIQGLDHVNYLTNHTLFNLTQRPERLGIIGAGVIGIEMAQAFNRLGSQVHVFERGERVLPREDPDAADIIKQTLEQEGVVFHFGADLVRINQEDPEGPISILDGSTTHHVDQLLVATGRKPNVEGLGLDLAGVELDDHEGIIVDDKLQTSNHDIFAAGDVATRFQFTHTADFMARIVVRNALFMGRDKFSDLLIPWCTYTEPEIAHVGLYPRDLEERGEAFDTYTKHMEDVDRAIVEEQTKGFVRVHVKKGGDTILGATVVGTHAGDLIGELALAMRSGTGLSALANVIHPYPTQGEAIRHVGDMYNRTRLTQGVKNVMRRYLDIKR